MKNFGRIRSILNVFVLVQFVLFLIAYYSEDVSDLMFKILTLSLFTTITIPLINIFREVRLILRTNLRIVSIVIFREVKLKFRTNVTIIPIILILFNATIFLVVAALAGARY